MAILPIKLLRNLLTQCYLVIFFLYPKVCRNQVENKHFFIYPSLLTLCLLRLLSSQLRIHMTITWLVLVVKKVWTAIPALVLV